MNAAQAPCARRRAGRPAIRSGAAGSCPRPRQSSKVGRRRSLVARRTPSSTARSDKLFRPRNVETGCARAERKEPNVCQYRDFDGIERRLRSRSAPVGVSQLGAELPGAGAEAPHGSRTVARRARRSSLHIPAAKRADGLRMRLRLRIQRSSRIVGERPGVWRSRGALRGAFVGVALRPSHGGRAKDRAG